MKNVSDLIRENAHKIPDKKAIVFSKKKFFGGFKYPFYTFLEFENRINQFCHKLAELGVKEQDKVLFFVKPNLDFSIITFALFRMGAIPVFIDPGMKRDFFFKAIEDLEPDVLIGIRKVHLLRRVKPQIFSSIKCFISTEKLSLFTPSIYKGLKKKDRQFKSFTPSSESLGAILFTSGGTGSPKGVEYTHEAFIKQTSLLQQEFNLSSDDIDIPGFPLFSFFTLGMGMTSCIPHMDFANPSGCDPEILYRNISDSNATFVAGSPAIWERLADYCLQNKKKLEYLKFVVMFGAPVSISLHRKFSKILPVGTSYTPYGATECLPVANISGHEILSGIYQKMNNGDGICVGNLFSGVKAKIIKTTDEKISDIKQIVELKPYDIGEIIVQAPHMTTAYFENEEATSKSKIIDGKTVWHRMGDLGYFDDDHKLWFCGRKAHLVSISSGDFYPTQVEAIFNQHPKIKRSALIYNESFKNMALAIEKTDHSSEIDSMFLMDLKNLAQSNEKTKNINEFVAYPYFPVDTRHNIKIDRTGLHGLIYGVGKS